MDNSVKIAQARQSYLDKSKAYEVSKAKGKAKDKLSTLSPAEREALTLLKQANDKVDDPKKLYELLQILVLAESE